MDDPELSRVIATALDELERGGELVITSAGVAPLADRIAGAVLDVVPSTGLTQHELVGVRSLILHALADKRFFDWEMPTLTGFSADEFRSIAEKLPRG